MKVIGHFEDKDIYQILPGTVVTFDHDCFVNLGDERKMPVHAGETWEMTEKIFRRIR